jgi:transcription elongation GreA/GreB family factor
MSPTSLDEALRAAGRAGPGSTVEVVDRAGRTTIYEIVARQPDSEPLQVTVDSAPGAALLGTRPGDAITIETANGRERRVWVVDVTSQPSGAETEPPRGPRADVR